MWLAGKLRIRALTRVDKRCVKVSTLSNLLDLLCRRANMRVDVPSTDVRARVRSWKRLNTTYGPAFRPKNCVSWREAQRRRFVHGQ
jgi:hypothetical protein